MLRSRSYLGQKETARQEEERAVGSFHSGVPQLVQPVSCSCSGMVPGLCLDRLSVSNYCVPGLGLPRARGSPWLPMSCSIFPKTPGGGGTAAGSQLGGPLGICSSAEEK